MLKEKKHRRDVSFYFAVTNNTSEIQRSTLTSTYNYFIHIVYNQLKMNSASRLSVTHSLSDVTEKILHHVT